MSSRAERPFRRTQTAVSAIRPLAAAAAVALAGCQMAPMPPDPTGRADADMLRVLAAFQASGAKPVPKLTVEQARSQPTPGDAAATVAQGMGMPGKPPVAKVADIQVQGAAGMLPARVCDPGLSRGPAPVIDLRSLPPTTIVLAEIGPLRSEGEALAQKLQAAGVPVEQRTYPGVTHEFFGMGAVVGQAKQAEDSRRCG